MKSATDAPPVLDDLPGYQIRRLQQIAVALFLQETAEHGVTPVQFAALKTIATTPAIDQRSLARSIGFDTSTLGGVVDRLETRGLVARNVSADDRRVRLLTLTPAGRAVLAAIEPGMLRAQQRILAPLRESERAEFKRLLDILVSANNVHSRAPSEG